MSRFQDILVHLGGEDAPWRAALPLARSTAGRLTLVEVLGDPPPQLVNQGRRACERLEQRWRVDMRAHLERVSERLTHEGLEVHTRLLEGPLAATLLDEIASGGHDLLVRQAEPGLRQDRQSLAQADDTLVRRCPRPVWLVKPRLRKGTRVAVAVDVSAYDAERAELNRGLVAAGAELASRLDLELHLASVIEPDDARARAALDALAEELVPVVSAERRHALHGDPGRELASFANDGQVEVLVVGALSRAGDKRLRLGHVAEDLLQRAGCSVLSLRPEAVGASLPA